MYAVPLAVIIVSYKANDLTVSYIKNELSKITIPYVAVIVNNGATSASDKDLADRLNAEVVADISKFGHTEATCYVISNPENSGFAKGNNIGAEFARVHFSPKYLLFSNNDIVFESENVVETLIKKISEDSNIGMIGPNIKGLEGKPQSPMPFRGFWSHLVLMLVLTPFLTLNRKQRIFNLDYAVKAREGFHYALQGSFFLLTASAFFDCGMMDPNTFLYGEELILAERLKKINKKLYYFPQVEVVHAHHQTINKHLTNKVNDSIYFNSLCYYYQTYFNIKKWQIQIAKIVRWFWRKIKIH